MEQPKEKNTPTLKVLVVDDSPVELNLMARTFTEEGYEVVLINSNPATIMTTKNFKDTPIILLTSKKEARDKFYGLKQGANAYMTKPFTCEELLSTASKLI